jgi:hypothetical protein
MSLQNTHLGVCYVATHPPCSGIVRRYIPSHGRVRKKEPHKAKLPFLPSRKGSSDSPREVARERRCCTTCAGG